MKRELRARESPLCGDGEVETPADPPGPRPQQFAPLQRRHAGSA